MAAIVETVLDSGEVDALLVELVATSPLVFPTSDDYGKLHYYRDFATPAVHRSGPLTVSVDSGGLSPSFTKRIRDELAKMGVLLKAMGEYDEALGHYRRVRDGCCALRRSLHLVWDAGLGHIYLHYGAEQRSLTGNDHQSVHSRSKNPHSKNSGFYLAKSCANC